MHALFSNEFEFSELEERIGYTFKDKSLLKKALTHKSYAFEAGQRENYEVLEFLGDAVVGLIVSEELVKRFPDSSEGELSRMKAYLVSEDSLSMLARTVDLGSFLFLGKGEHLTGGREKYSILCDVFEALFGAIYLDGGFSKAKEVFSKCFLDRLWKRINQCTAYGDYKGLLQEVAQRRFGALPVYKVVKCEGPDHDRQFTVECRLARFKSLGVGKSKKSAEQSAAKKMLKLLEAL